MRSLHFGTKAETLERLGPLLKSADVLPLAHFTVAHWRDNPNGVVSDLHARFDESTLVVRSSAIGEDSDGDSKAGEFSSVLGVPRGVGTLSAAIECVIASYHGNPQDQILVQPMLEDVVMSGVVMTNSLVDGAPYYTINYDTTGSTHAVTAGDRISKTVYVHRDVGSEYVRSARIQRLIALAGELEQLCGEAALDFEFGMTSTGRVVLFQVRRISVRAGWRAGVADEVDRQLPHVRDFIAARSRPRPGLVGTSTLLGNMPDWNPAEMIGSVPGPLAASLYRYLITKDVWRRSREAMGYRPVRGEELMVMLGGRPYIDVRNSFNSLVPADLDETTAGRLVDAWQDFLRDRPELHDKIEFEVALSCLTLNFDTALASRFPGVLGSDERDAFRDSLRTLTNRAVDLGPTSTLVRAERAVSALAEIQKRGQEAGDFSHLAKASALLEQCQRLGTLPFATLARHAFMAESLLRSAVARGAMAPDRVAALKRTMHTVTTDLSRDLARVLRGDLARADFLRVYGHLRPGTYDIRSPRYDHRNHLFDGGVEPAPRQADPEPFEIHAAERRDLTKLLSESGIDASVDLLSEYARRAIVGREWAKFVFSRNLSDALELFAAWGEEHGLSRETLSYVGIDELRRFLSAPPLESVQSFMLERAEAGIERTRRGRALKLGFLIRDIADIYVVPVHRAQPSFVGCGVVRGPVVVLSADSDQRLDLFGRIVCIERADPGFDFIFSKGIAALITKYGGSNSHMAIRCNELRIPGAIGCGEQTFRRIIDSAAAELDCDHHILRPVHGA